MSITREYVKSLPEGKNKKHYQQIVKAYEANDKWAKKAIGKMCILITSHPGNRPFLKACLDSHEKLGMWMILAYDNYWHPTDKNISYDLLMPKREVFDKVNTFLVPNYQTWGGVLYPYFWLLKFGLQTANCFEYVYCVNGDCILEKPENFNKLIDMLGDGDIMGCGWEETKHGRGLFSTAGWIGKTSAANAILKHFQDHLIPIDNYEKYAQQMGNTESRFAIAIKDLNLKHIKVPENPYNEQFHKPGFGTWYKTIGFRHIHGEWGYGKKHGRGEIPWEYIDKSYF